MGGAVQSFSSPMLAQGMQGGLSGFGTSGVGMFELGGVLTAREMNELNHIHNSQTMADGGQLSTIEQILAKYNALDKEDDLEDDSASEVERIADERGIPVDVLMEAISDLGYEDKDAEKVADEYYTSVPASMGNEFRDFAYEYIDSIGGIESAVSNPESYFDFESFGSDARMDYSDEELEEMGFNELSDEELGERLADDVGGANALGEKTLEMYFDYDRFARDLEYDFISFRGEDGNYYFFNRNFAKGGTFKMGGDVKKPTWIAIYQKGNDRKILEVDASSIEEAKLEAEEDKKRYRIPQEMFLYDIYRKFAEGGEIAQGNYEMMLSQAKEVQHHTTELQSVLKKEKNIDAWVVAKMENVSSTLSDITHYLDGKTEYAKGGKVESFLQRAKQGLKKGYKKSKEYTQKKIHDTKKNIALEVLDSTKGKVPNAEKNQLKIARTIVNKKYADGGELISEIKKKYVTAGNDSEGVWTYSRTTANEIAKKYNGEVQEDGSKLYVSLKKFAKGGKVGNRKLKSTKDLYEKLNNAELNWKKDNGAEYHKVEKELEENRKLYFELLNEAERNGRKDNLAEYHRLMSMRNQFSKGGVASKRIVRKLQRKTN